MALTMSRTQRRSACIRVGQVGVLVGAVLASLAACGKPMSGPDGLGPPDGRPGDARTPGLPGQKPGQPGLGASGLNYYRLGNDPNRTSRTSISTPLMETQGSGSTMIVSIGRGSKSLFAIPTDNKGNAPYRQLGTVHSYTHWQDSGTALYAFESAKGGSDHLIRTSTNDHDEITVAAVEVVEGTRVIDFTWNEVVQPEIPIAVRSNSVTTTGPATLIAFWWGDADQNSEKDAKPSLGFTRVDHILTQGSLVQCAVAVRNVDDAGTYDITWEATPVQGAQLWLVAVER